VGAFKNLQALAAVLKHLGHEGHSIELAFLIQRFENFLFTPHLNPIARTQSHILSHLLY
jgi:hypothetical protein